LVEDLTTIIHTSNLHRQTHKHIHTTYKFFCKISIPQKSIKINHGITQHPTVAGSYTMVAKCVNARQKTPIKADCKARNF